MPYEPDLTRHNAATQSEHLRRVREAAEAIFRPKTPQSRPAPATAHPTIAIRESDTRTARVSPAPQPARAEATVPLAASVHHEHARAPRLIPIEQQSRVVPETEGEVEGESESKKIRKLEHDRIRVLATYGMTVGQVATLYGVTHETIKKIVSQQRSGRRQLKDTSTRVQD